MTAGGTSRTSFPLSLARRRRSRPAALLAAAATLTILGLGPISTTASAHGATPAATSAAASTRDANALGQLLTYGYGNARDGHDTGDPAFAHLRYSWFRAIGGGLYGQPLVDGNLVIVASELDEVYAFDAATGKLAWKFSIGRHTTTAVVDRAPTLGNGCGDINPLGITGTPVIDPKTDDLFVAGEVQTGSVKHPPWQGIKHVMVAVHFTDSRVSVLWDRDIDPPHAGTTYVVAAEQQRSALTLANGRVYAEFGGLDGDCGRYQGYVLSLTEAGTGYRSFKVPTSREGAIWATGGAATSASGELFVATGNSANGPGGAYDYGDSVIGLSPLLKIDGFFAPRDWALRNARDLDLGSGGPIILPNSNYVFEIGKGAADGVSTGYLLDAAHLGGHGRPLYSGRVCSSDGFVFGADASAVLSAHGKKHTYLYVPCPSGTVALWVNHGTHPSFSVKWRASGPNGPPIIAGGLVWALATNSDGGGGPSKLYGMDPITGKVDVAVSVNPVEHFATPGAGDDTMFVATQSGLMAFKP